MRASGLCSGYDGVTVIKGIDLEVENEVFAVLGANGAGKTTLLATLARLIPIMSGELVFEGEEISGAENLDVGGMIGTRPLAERKDEIFEWFPVLADLSQQLAGTLSGGESRMLACGRALMQEPKLLLLDEPTTGLSPIYVDMFFEKITEIRKSRGVSIILAEQNATKALEVADRVMVLSLGEVFLTGDAKGLTTEQLKEGYRI